MTAVGESTENSVRSDLQASRLRRCVSWPFAVSTSGSIDRSTIQQSNMQVQPDVGKATLNKALEQGMIGDDKDFFREDLREVE